MIYCCMQQQCMRHMPSQNAYYAAADSAWRVLLQPSEAPAEAALNCIPVCRPGLHKGTAARALSRVGSWCRGISRSCDKPAFKAKGQPYSIEAQQPKPVHNCSKIQGNGIVTP